MSSNNISGPIPILYRNANPLLFTLRQDHMTIQPYWIMVLEILTIQILQRFWNLYRYKEFLSTVEIGLIRWILWIQIVYIKNTLNHVDDVMDYYCGPLENLFLELVNAVSEHRVNSKQRRKELLKSLKFDWFNFIINALPLLGHSIWYCIIQSSCMSAKDANIWNCYNAFGYRLYNYIFVSYANFFGSFLVKIIALKEKHSSRFRICSFDWFGYQLGLWSSILTFLFIGSITLSYLFTHVIPMILAYLFMTIVYIALWSSILIFAVFFYNKVPILKYLDPVPKIFSVAYRKLAMVPLIFALGIYTYPILMSTLYNYSQYLYYGENYIYTMSNEFKMRDTKRYLQVLQNSINEKFHTTLNFI